MLIIKTLKLIAVIFFLFPGDFTGPMNYIRAAVRGFNVGRYYEKPVQGVPLLLIWGTRDGALTTELADKSSAYADDFTLRYKFCFNEELLIISFNERFSY